MWTSIFAKVFSGEVHFYRNASAPRVIMHVDHTQRLWMFFDVYGTTQRIRLLGKEMVFGFTTLAGIWHGSGLD